MPRIDREAIADEIRDVLVNNLRELYPHIEGPDGFWITPETAAFRLVAKVDPSEQLPARADLYIGPGDGGGPIIVTVERRNSDKWNQWAYFDGKSVRILKVDADKNFHLINPRGTQFEADLLECLEMGLKR